MERPKGSRNRPKSNGGTHVETTEHRNDDELTDEQQHALLDQSARSYTKALDAKKLADANFKNVCKGIKSDGVKLSAVKLYLKAETEEGQAEIREQVEEAARIARWRSFPLGTQFGIFAEGDGAQPSRSFVLGKEAGLAGEPAKAPHNADVNEFLAGWQAGQAALMGGIKPLPEAEAAPDEF